MLPSMLRSLQYDQHWSCDRMDDDLLFDLQHFRSRYPFDEDVARHALL